MTLQAGAENRVRSKCSWDTYQRLLKDNESVRSPRFTYDRGWLEIMSPSFEHERVNEALRHLVSQLAEHLGLDLLATGSTTFKSEELQRGFEPDSSYYVRHAELMRSVSEPDMNVQPAPELVIEIEISRSSESKLDLFRSLGVGEVWRWTGNQLVMVELVGGSYQEVVASVLFPGARAAALSELVSRSRRENRLEWNRAIRNWLQTDVGGGSGG